MSDYDLIIRESIAETGKALLAIFRDSGLDKIVLGIIASTIIVCIIKKIVKSASYSFYRMSGDNKRTSKRKARRNAMFVDLTSNSIDLHNNLHDK